MPRLSTPQILAAVAVLGAFASVPVARAAKIPMDFAWTTSAKSAHAATARKPASTRTRTQALKKLRPEWSGQEACEMAPNGSFLSTVNLIEEQTISDTLMSSRSAATIRQRYDDMVRGYELQSRHNLTSPGDQMIYNQKVVGFSRGVVRDIQNGQVKGNLEKTQEAFERNPGLRPLGWLMGLAYIYVGRPLKLKIDQATQLTARTEVRSQRGELEMTSPIVDTKLGFVAQAPTIGDRPVDGTRDERYRVSLSRNVPVLDLRSGLSYGTTTDTVTASLSKRLTQNITAVVDGSRTTRTTDRPEGNVKVTYEIKF